MDEIQIAPGELVFAEGEPGNAMFIIRSGRVVVLKGSLDAPTVLGYRSAGEIIGEMALLENEPRSASVVALEPVRVLSITRSNFEQLIGQNPALGLSILSTLSARLRAADDARKSSSTVENTLSSQVSRLQDEKQQLMELERLRQDTIDLIVHDLRHPISSLFGAIKIDGNVLQKKYSLKINSLDLPTPTANHLQLMVVSMLDIAKWKRPI
jgi:CRP-like cAMP-binding protein